MSIGIQNGNVYGEYMIQATLTPTAVSASRTAGQNFTATNFAALANLRLGDMVFVNGPVITTGVAVTGGRVSSNGVLTMNFVNATGSIATPSPGVYQILVVRPEGQLPSSKLGD